jgi:hypothetical protein
MPTRTLRRTPILAPAYYMLLLQSVTDYVACSNAFQGAQLLCALTSAATSNETRTAGCDRHLHPTLSRSDEFDTMATVGALMQFIALLCVIEWVVAQDKVGFGLWNISMTTRHADRVWLSKLTRGR